MNKAIKYQWSDVKRTLCIYYSVIILVVAFFFIVGMLTKNDGETYSSFNGLEMCTGIFLFVVGLNSFKEQFFMFLQNGISRKSIWKSRVVYSLSLCAVMAVADMILMAIGGLFHRMQPNLYFTSVLAGLYQDWFLQNNAVLVLLLKFLLFFAVYLAAFSAGYFITMLYYRIGRRGKIALSIGLWGVPFVGFPLVDDLLLNNRASRFLLEQLFRLLGLNVGNPVPAIITFLAVSIILYGLWYLLGRRAVVK